MKRVAEDKPVVGIVEVLDPVEVRLALRVIPPDIAGVAVALEGYVQDAIRATASRMLSRLYRIRHLIQQDDLLG